MVSCSAADTPAEIKAQPVGASDISASFFSTRYQQAELINGRTAMTAVAGILIPSVSNIASGQGPFSE